MWERCVRCIILFALVSIRLLVEARRSRGAKAYGLNAVGLERRGFSKERIKKLHHAYKVLLASKLNTSQALEKLKAETDVGEDVEMLIRFIEASERGVIK